MMTTSVIFTPTLIILILVSYGRKLISSISRGLAKRASFRCVTSVELESISRLKWQSLLQMPWLVVVWQPQHLCINFCIVVLLLTSNRSCLLVVVPIVLGIVTQIVNTLQFLLSIHQSLSQPNILAIVLPLMLLRSGMTSLKMFAVQHQLPPSERSLKHTCLQKPTHHSLPVTSVSPWYDLAMSLD